MFVWLLVLAGLSDKLASSRSINLKVKVPLVDPQDICIHAREEELRVRRELTRIGC